MNIRLSILCILVALLPPPVHAQQGHQDLHPYFSPKGGCTQAALATAKKSILVQACSFTMAPIARALVDAKKRGVDVQVLLDKSKRTEIYRSVTFLPCHQGRVNLSACFLCVRRHFCYGTGVVS